MNKQDPLLKLINDLDKNIMDTCMGFTTDCVKIIGGKIIVWMIILQIVNFILFAILFYIK